MNKLNVVDSSGWIEYFLDTSQADYFEPAILNTDALIVPVIALYEVHKRISQLVPPAVVTQCMDVMRHGRVLPLTDAQAIAASVIAQQYKLAMADAVMYSMALEHEALFWTQDIDYHGLPSVRFQARPD